ncbi:hypothetical protein CR513_53250, partial [Mucuna pruriens]
MGYFTPPSKKQFPWYNLPPKGETNVVISSPTASHYNSFPNYQPRFMPNQYIAGEEDILVSSPAPTHYIEETEEALETYF